MAEILIKSGGALSLVQDLGRIGYQKMGMPVAGAMDDYAARCANILVGNSENDALIEAALYGPEIESMGKNIIAVTGADMGAEINGVKIKNWKSYLMNRGDILKLKGAVSGVRSYVAILGGIDLPLVMGSRATYLKGGIGGMNGRALKAGDILSTKSAYHYSIREMDSSYIPEYGDEVVLRAVSGPNTESFADEGLGLFAQEYTASVRSDRMGIFLEGTKLDLKKESADILSSAILMGSIQVTNDATPVILMADRQTTGGYAQIATVISPDLPKAAQAKPGTKIRFQKVNVRQAQGIYMEYEQKIATIKAGLGHGLTVKSSSTQNININGNAYRAIIEEVL